MLLSVVTGECRGMSLGANCHSRVGYVFGGERHPPPTDQRYRINF